MNAKQWYQRRVAITAGGVRPKMNEVEESSLCLGSVAEDDGGLGEEALDKCPLDEDSLASTQNADYKEERFRVDRRKLEQLLQAAEDEKQNAEEFFTEIMQQTNTTIVWPSKLKIGAKSKKDPLIKVCGLKDAVVLAKEKIMGALDTKSLRVTLKMEVSHTEHSHVIGKGGNNIQRVMQETDCHIHFPDSNRNNLGEKSNQVSITGQCLSVETGRMKIRMLLPLVIVFELPNSLSPPAPLDGSSTVIQQIQQRYGVSIIVKQHLQPGHGYVQTIIVRGSVCSAKAIEDASVAVFETLTGRIGISFSVTLLMDIATPHHATIIGYEGSNIKQIIRRTGATIYFPDTNSVNSPRSTMYISGPIPNVFHARQELMGWLPVVLMFDIKEEKRIEQNQIAQLMEQLDVFISLKPKSKQPLKSVIVKSTEHNINNVYEARKLLLSLPEPQSKVWLNESQCATTNTVISTASRTNSCTSVSGSHQLTCSNSTAVNGNHFISPTVIQPHVSPGFQPVIILPSVQSYHLPVALSSTFPGSHLKAMKASPGGGGGLLSISNQTGAFNISSLSASQVPESYRSGSTGKLTTSLSWSSGLSLAEKSQDSRHSIDTTSSNRPSTNDAISLKTQSAAPFEDSSAFVSKDKELIGSQNSFDVSTVLSLDTESLLKLCLRKNPTFPSTVENSGEHGLSSPVPACKMTLPPYKVDEASENLSLFANRQNLQSSSVFQKSNTDDPNGSRSESLGSASQRFGPLHSPLQLNSSPLEDPRDVLLHGSESMPYELCNTNSSDPSKAPGRGRPKKLICSSFLTPNDTASDFDYEGMKLSATRAMQQKPLGDSRMPTDCWSGLYFSKSMPDSALFDKLNQNVFHGRGLTSTAASENTEEETEDKSWKSALHSYNCNSLKMPDRYNYNALPGGHLYDSASKLSDAALASASSAEYSRGKSSERRVNVFADPLSKLSEIWQPKTKENIPAEQPYDLAELFSKLGLGKYSDLFQQQEIDLATFLTLTEGDLKELGISTFGARRKMLLAIADHNERRRFIPPPPGLPNPFRNPNLPRCHDAGSQSGRW